MTKKYIAFVLMVLVMIISLNGNTVVRAIEPGKANGQAILGGDNILPRFDKVRSLDVLNLNNVNYDERLMMVSLQGIVNRERPRIYFIEGKPDEGGYTWLNDLKVDYAEVDNLWGLFGKYKSCIDGMIIYDPQMTDSINIATTLAGLENSIIVSPELANKLKAPPYNLKVVYDLQGKFKNKIEAYEWAFDNLWNRANHQMLIGLSPTRSVDIPPDNWKTFETLLEEKREIKDASNRDNYSIDLSAYLSGDAVYLKFEDSYTYDGWGPSVYNVSVKADDVIIAQFNANTEGEEAFIYDKDGSKIMSDHRFADGQNYFVYKFKIPEDAKSLTVIVNMANEFKVSASNVKPISSDAQVPYGYLRDYAVANNALVIWLDPNVPDEEALFERILSNVEHGTPYLGWFPSDVSGEFNGTQLCSTYGVEVLASDWFNNMTVFSGTRYKNFKPKTIKTPTLENKIYVTYTMSEGDNLQYNQHAMRKLWEDENRGNVPINWTVSPILYDAAPIILNYYRQTATSNDLLVCGPSGAGYIYPNNWPDETFDKYIDLTKWYLNRTHMDIIYILNRIDQQSVELSDIKEDAYARLNLKGIFYNWNDISETKTLKSGLIQSDLLSTGNAQQAEDKIRDLANNWDGQSPMFISLGILAWTTTPTDLVNITNNLGPEFKVVRGDQFFELFKEENMNNKK